MIKLFYILLFSMVYGIEVKHLDYEHPKLKFLDPEFFSNVSMKATRLSRSDNTHYFDLNMTILKSLDKDVTITILLQRQHTVSSNANLLELHYRFCDMVNNNNILTKQFKEAFYRIPKEKRPMPDFTCPMKTGIYTYVRMGMPEFLLPNSFPVLDGGIVIILFYKSRVIFRVNGIFHVK